MELKVESALISVYAKEGLDDLLSILSAQGVELISTGGTWEYITQQGYEAIKVETLSGYPSILGGRVKTLHPSIFGGILARRRHKSDEEQLATHKIRTIDLVVVDLYPFEAALASGASEEELIEKIDIGGVSLLRAAAKNFLDVVVISSRDQYARLVQILKSQDGKITLEQRRDFAKAAFVHTANYDSAIAGYFAGATLPP
ncbi:MAG: bifunctional phosphoribosylaminoimidazolecarboxamide formyltransferase/IMP cyclohydrolase, partial [Bacteroides sp.]